MFTLVGSKCSFLRLWCFAINVHRNYAYVPGYSNFSQAPSTLTLNLMKAIMEIKVSTISVCNEMYSYGLVKIYGRYRSVFSVQPILPAVTITGMQTATMLKLLKFVELTLPIGLTRLAHFIAEF